MLAINMAKWRLLVLTENGIHSAGRLVKAILKNSSMTNNLSLRIRNLFSRALEIISAFLL